MSNPLEAVTEAYRLERRSQLDAVSARLVKGAPGGLLRASRACSRHTLNRI
jgi:hypothetical protein